MLNLFFIGTGLFVLVFGVLLMKKINILPKSVHVVIILVNLTRMYPECYMMELYTEIKTLESKYIIYVFFLAVIIVIGFILSLRRYVFFNITMGKTENVCINKYKGITVDYSKGFKEKNKGFKEYKNGTITIDFNDGRNKLKITLGENIKGATVDLRKVKDRALRKDIIRNIKEEISNNKTNSSWSSTGLIYIVLGGWVIFRKIVFGI